MGNIITVNTNAEFAAWLDEIRTEAPAPQTMRFDEDPVALGCAAYRMWKETNVVRWQEFDHLAVSDVDRELANRIRSYYRARTEHILFDVLKRGTAGVSEFRKKLALIAAGQMTEFTRQDLGILYKLPYFYHEDTALDRVFEHNAPAEYYSTPEPQSQQRLRLQLLDRVLVSRKHGETVQYWFASPNTPARYQWSVQTNNPLHSFVESFVRFREIEISARTTVRPIRHRPNGVHYAIFNVELV
jgi:hypothetical protein